MKVANVGKKNPFVPITIAITFESQKEVNEFIEGATEIEGEGYACELGEVLDGIREALSK